MALVRAATAQKEVPVRPAGFRECNRADGPLQRKRGDDKEGFGTARLDRSARTKEDRSERSKSDTSLGASHARIPQLQGRMAQAGIEAAVILYSRDLFYYTGTAQPAFLLVTQDDHALLVRWGWDFVLRETWLDRGAVRHWSGYEDLRGFLRGRGLNRGHIGLEMDVIPAEIYLKILEACRGFEARNITPMILEQRMIKDDNEVEWTRAACRIVHAGHERLLRVFREGMTELELSSEIERAHRAHGHEGEYFMRQFDFVMSRGPVVSGENLSKISGRIRSISGIGLSPSVPAGASDRAIRKGDLLMVDIPTHYRGYHADQSRTYSVGRPSALAKRLHDALKEIADRTLEDMRPGVSCAHLYRSAMEISRGLGTDGFFMRIGTEAAPLDFIGHGIGLDINEPPLIGPRGGFSLKPGMTLALELVMTASPREVVKLEDTLLVTPGGGELLTITPRELHEL
jgi:Xaa-Pro dipeptidase